MSKSKEPLKKNWKQIIEEKMVLILLSSFALVATTIGTIFTQVMSSQNIANTSQIAFKNDVIKTKDDETVELKAKLSRFEVLEKENEKLRKQLDDSRKKPLTIPALPKADIVVASAASNAFESLIARFEEICKATPGSVAQKRALLKCLEAAKADAEKIEMTPFLTRFGSIERPLRKTDHEKLKQFVVQTITTKIASITSEIEKPTDSKWDSARQVTILKNRCNAELKFWQERVKALQARSSSLETSISLGHVE